MRITEKNVKLLRVGLNEALPGKMVFLCRVKRPLAGKEMKMSRAALELNYLLKTYCNTVTFIPAIYFKKQGKIKLSNQ